MKETPKLNALLPFLKIISVVTILLGCLIAFIIGSILAAILGSYEIAL